jgi:hypothetical protein
MDGHCSDGGLYKLAQRGKYGMSSLFPLDKLTGSPQTLERASVSARTSEAGAYQACVLFAFAAPLPVDDGRTTE